MQSLFHFFVFELQQALQDFTAGGFANDETDALLGFVEVVVQIEIGPEIGRSNCLIYRHMEFSEFLNLG